MRELYNGSVSAGHGYHRWSANRAGTRDQRKVKRGDPARGQLVDRRDRVEGPQPGRQAPRRGRIPPRAVGEPERGFLEDARRSFDVPPVDIVVVAGWPVGGGVQADAVDVLELDAGFALVEPVDGEPDGGDVARLDDALRRLAI